MNWFNLFISRHGRKAFGLQLCMHVCPTFDILIAALRVDVCPLLLFGAWGCWDKTQTDFSQRVLSHHPAMLETHLQNFSKPHMIPNSIANRKLVESDLVSPKYISFCTALLPGMAEGWWQHKWGETICWQVQSRVYNGDWKTSYHFRLSVDSGQTWESKGSIRTMEAWLHIWKANKTVLKFQREENNPNNMTCTTSSLTSQSQLPSCNFWQFEPECHFCAQLGSSLWVFGKFWAKEVSLWNLMISSQNIESYPVVSKRWLSLLYKLGIYFWKQTRLNPYHLQDLQSSSYWSSFLICCCLGPMMSDATKWQQ